MKREYEYWVGDFETTVYKGQTETLVWASACVQFYSEDVKIFNSIGEQFDYFVSLEKNVCVYYHNLKFDGNFWLSFLLNDLHYKQAVEKIDERHYDFLADRNMPVKSFKYLISNMGAWYGITIRLSTNTYLEIRDSLKLLPFSVKKIGNSFGTKHKKLDMKYEGFRYPGCYISPEEKAYIANDVLVVKEALEIMQEQGHTKLTIGACCLSEYKNIVGDKWYSFQFPNLYQLLIDETIFGVSNVGEYIRKSYRGGWCYLVKGKECKIKHNGTTADVNSLYPSVMSSESGSKYPIGNPVFWHGNFIPQGALLDSRFYFIRIRTRFYIKKDKLPFIQIKGNLLYPSTESLTTSDVYDPDTDKYYSKYINDKGEVQEAFVTLTLTMMDYELIKEHYDLVDCEILDGCYFNAKSGIFDEYIDKYKKIKIESKGALRELAKLFLNNLYGKMAASTNSSCKVAYTAEDGTVGFITSEEYKKNPGYIAVGSAITSYARCFTIRAAQQNYYGVDKAGFIYADTDSIHCDLLPEQIKGIKVDNNAFCCWKLESCWDIGFFTRQKTYIEHIVKENLEDIDNPYYNVKCAGMPEKCKQLFVRTLQGDLLNDNDKDLTEDEKKFLMKKRTIEDFKVGLVVPGKLMPRRIPGGVLLMETTYEMR